MQVFVPKITHNKIFKTKIRVNKNCATITTTDQKVVTGNSAGLLTDAENAINLITRSSCVDLMSQHPQQQAVLLPTVVPKLDTCSDQFEPPNSVYKVDTGSQIVSPPSTSNNRNINICNSPRENADIFLKSLSQDLLRKPDISNSPTSPNDTLILNTLDKVENRINVEIGGDTSIPQQGLHSSFEMQGTPSADKVGMGTPNFSEAEVYNNHLLADTNFTHHTQSISPGAAVHNIDNNVNVTNHTMHSVSADIYSDAAKVRICPMNVDRCKELFKGYDQDRLEVVLNNIEFGVQLHSNIVSTNRPDDFYNHKSALEHYDLVSKKLEKELKKGRICGPFPVKPPGLIVSPLASVPKDKGTDIRLIHDLSFPKGCSVNSHIPKELCFVEYETLDDCLSIIASLGKRTLMSKTDISSAYRIFEVRKADYRLLGFTWNNQFYWDRCLPMGCSVSCGKFEEFSKLLQWMMKCKFNVAFMSHIIDDFMFFGPHSSHLCQQYLDLFIQVCQYLGIPIKFEKTFNASTCLELHGIKVCTETMVASLPIDKLEKANTLIDNMLSRSKTSIKELQELCGFLNFCLRIIPSARPFMRRLYNATRGNRPRWFRVRVSSDIKEDLRVWKMFLEKFNGKCVISSEVWGDEIHLHIFSDASGFAFGAYYQDKWLQGSFPSSWKDVNIAVKEFVPVYLAFRLWCKDLSNCKVMFHVDNISVVHMLNNQTSHVNVILVMLREMVLQAMFTNVQFVSKHVPGISNTICDLLSRLQISKALKAAPWLNQEKTPIPEDWDIWTKLCPL